MSRIAFTCEFGEKKGSFSGISRCTQSAINAIVNGNSQFDYMLLGNDLFDVPIKKVPYVIRENQDIVYDCITDMYDIDIVHSFWTPVVGRSDKVRRVITVHDLCPLVNIDWYDDKEGSRNFFDVLGKRLTDFDKIIAISHSTKKDILKYYDWVDEKNIEVVHWGNESRLTIDNYLTDVTSDKFRLGDGYILGVNTFVKRKNIEGTIAAFEMYKEAHANSKLKLVLTGRIEKTNDVYETVTNSKFKESIVTTGYVSDEELLSLYRNCLCVMYPSFYEGFGLPIVEAMSLGKTVITSNISSMPEIGEDAVYCCNPYDVESIMDGIEKLVEDESYRKKLEEKAISQAAKFSYERTAREMVEIYKGIARLG